MKFKCWSWFNIINRMKVLLKFSFWQRHWINDAIRKLILPPKKNHTNQVNIMSTSNVENHRVVTYFVAEFSVVCVVASTLPRFSILRVVTTCFYMTISSDFIVEKLTMINYNKFTILWWKISKLCLVRISPNWWLNRGMWRRITEVNSSCLKSWCDFELSGKSNLYLNLK